jgi:uncharacterized cysteine cluster protein YcgN (CxxCxxCC family)
MKHMDVRIKNGSPLHGESLCETCSRAHITRGFSESQKVVVCQAIYPERHVPFKVCDCTSYLEVKRQSLKQMEEIAWVLMPREGKRKAGFVPAREMEEESEIELFLSEPE